VICLQIDSFAKFFPERLQDKIEIIPNPIQQQNHQPSQVQREKLIVCIARLQFNQKRQDILLQAFSQITNLWPDWHLAFYGAEYGEFGNQLQKMIDGYKLSANVHIMGTTTNVESVLRRASVFAFPSVYEGFPNALAEALSWGVPAIGFRGCPGVSDLIVNGENGILVDGVDNIMGFAQALDLLLGDRELRQKMGDAAIRSIEPYSPERVMELWVRTIDSVCDTLYSRGPGLLKLHSSMAAQAFDAVVTHYNYFTNSYNDRVERLIGGLERRDQIIAKQSQRLAEYEQQFLERGIAPTRIHKNIQNLEPDLRSVVASKDLDGNYTTEAYSRREGNRYWWWKIPGMTGDPLMYHLMKESERKLISEWYDETEAKRLIGECAPPLAAFLQGFIGGNAISRIVQLGHYAGYSTLMIGMILRKIGKGRLFSVDHSPKNCKYTEKWVKKAALDDYVVLNCNDSAATHLPYSAVEVLGGEPELLIIDSAHTYSQTIRELDLWMPALKKNGFVLLHDASEAAKTYDIENGGVAGALNHWCKRNGYQYFVFNGGDATPGSKHSDLVYRDGRGLGIIQKVSINNISINRKGEMAS
jgi:predicted O-methyltransferase YrrM